MALATFSRARVTMVMVSALALPLFLACYNM